MPTSTSSISYPATSLNQIRLASLPGVVTNLRRPANLTGEQRTHKRLTRCLLWVTGLLLSISQLAQAQVSGTVFRDFNANGVKDTYDVGVASVTVTAYTSAAASVVVSTTTGSYSFAAVTLPSGTPVRLEFTYPATTGDFNAPFSAAAAGNGTAVQFVTAGAAATNINFAVNLPNDYCQANPLIVIPCYQNGLRTTNTQAALVAFPYNATGQTGPETTNATVNQVGATWGTDYQVVQKRLFAGALLKRHVDLGSQGTGGMYVLDYTASATAPAISSFTLQGVTPAVGPAIDLGTVNRTAAANGLAASNFQLSSSSTTPNIDLDTYTKVGKTSLGDVDLDQTAKTLWTVNLNQRSLISVDVSGATLPGAINHYALETLPGYPTPAAYTNTGTTTLRINAGGAGFTDASGNTWVADQNFTGGTTPSTASAIANVGNPYETTNGTQSLYQSVRAGSSFNYAVPVVNGRYRVVLHLSDFTSTAAGQRLTITTAENFTALGGVDLWTARAAVANRATTSQFVVDVTDGTLNLAFTGSGTSNEARVAGIEIVPVPSGASGVMRPWGLGFRNGKGYLGVVSDASNSLRRTDLQAYVLAFDPANVAAGFTTTLSFPLNFNRENVNGDNTPGYWTAWRSEITMQGDVKDPSYRRTSPQPLISDIDFSENGSMEIGFLDRSGNQEGFSNNVPFAGTTLLNGSGIRTAGDILHACFINGGFVLEQGNSGTICKSSDPGGSLERTDDGPANAGEFYYDDVYTDVGTGQSLHMENATGALLQRKGSGEILTTVYDPTRNAPNNGLFSQGVHWYNNLTGAKTDEYVVVSFTGNVGSFPYDPSGFGKANGLGDPTMRCDAAPLEIGNRVFRDDNRNGIQDPTESGISGVAVTLYKGTTLVATATTNTDGEYYFSSGTGTNTAAAIYSLTALAPGSTVQLRINGAQTALASLSLSPANQGSNRAIDNDFAPGAPGSATAVANVTLGANGQNVHTFDAGLFACPTITFTAPASATTTVCANTTLNMSVSTTAKTPDQIRFVYFNSPLATVTDAYTATGGTVLGTVTSGTLATNTVTLPNVQLPDNVGSSSVNLFVYAILVSADEVCQPVAQRVIVLTPRPVASIAGNPLLCQGATAILAVNASSGATVQFFLGNGTTAVSTANPFTTPAISTTTTYRARITSSGCVSDDASITLTPVPCTPCVASPTTVGGTVFRDFNGDGVDAATEPGMSGVTVTIFRCDATNQSTQVTTQQTDLNGSYSFTGLTAGTDYRVEFSNLPTGYLPTYRGTNNGTTVQFTKPGSCTTSLGLNQPIDYCQANPLLATSCYINGATTNTASPRDVLVSFSYNNSGTTPAPTHLASKDEIGSTWGLAYNRYLKRLYTATFLKRQVGIKDSDGDGTADLGVIWVTNPATATSQVWADLAKAPYNLNVGTIGTDAQRGLGLPTAPALDAEAFSKVNKAGLGDIDISDDGKNLYVVNLKTKTLHQIAINADGTAGAMTTLPIPNPCGPGYTKLNINAGATRNAGGFVTGWKADGYFINSTVFTTTQTTLPFTNGRAGATVAYKVPVDNGSYSVTLYFATNATARNQTNQVEGSTQTLSLSANSTAVQTFTVTVSDDILDIQATDLPGGDANAVLSGIEITPTGGQTFLENAPFALKFKDNAVYVGVTCTGEYSQNKSDLRATVYRLPVGSGTYTPVLSFPLDYPKGPSFANNCPTVTGWFPWTSVESNVCSTYPSPTLADLEFDVDGSMILGFIDRYAHQVGWNNTNMADGGLVSAVSGGDILRASFSNGIYTLENNGRVGTLAGGVNTNQGPGGGEFYSGEQITAGGITPHQETAQGGLALLPGSGQVASINMDPVDGPTSSFATGGVNFFSNINGSKQRSYQVFSAALAGAGTFGKSSGLGDLELFCDLAPIQIGNRVWRDDNRNGIQDPCEPPIAGAVVKLYDAAKTTVLASVTTNAAGEYYFSSATVVAGTSTSSVSTSLLTYNTTYGLAITSLGTGTAVTGLTLTDVSPVTPGESGTLNSGLTINNNDAKVDVVGGISSPCIKLTTGGPGSTNHTYDFGIAKNLCSLTATASASSQSICAGQSVTLTAQATPVGSYTYAWSGPASVSITPTNAATVTATNLATGVNTFTVTVSSSPSCQTTATVLVTVVAPPVVTLTSATVCAGQPISLTASGAGTGATYVFSVSGATGNVLTVTPTATTVYTVTATTTGGCSATATGTVTVNPLPDAGPDQLLVCGPLGQTPTSTNLTATPVGGLWSNASGNPTLATFTPNAGSGMTTAGNLVSGTYMFNYTVNGCVDAVMVTVPVCQTFCAEIAATATASSNTLTPGQSVTLMAQVSPAGSYTYAWSGPGTITPTNAATVTASGLSNGVNTFTVTVTSSPGCFTTATVSVTVLTPALSVSVGTPVCNTLTNNYTASGTVSLTNAQAGSLTITDNGTTTATIPVTTGQTSATFSATGVSGSSPASHSVVVSLGTATASTTYATPASCTVCSLSLTTSSLPNGQVGTAYSQTLTTTGGTAPLSFSLTGSLPDGLTLDATTGVISGTPTSATTASFSVVVTDAKACTAVTPLTITVGNAPVCSLTATVTPGVCNTATNQYTVTGTISATNTTGNQSLTVAVGSNSVLVALNGNGPASFSLTGLESDGLPKTLTVISSATACGSTSQTFTAPASCTIGLALTVTPGVCNTLTNGYDITGTLSLTNAQAGTATISDGTSSTTVTVNAGDTSVPYSLTGLPSGSGNRIVTVNYAGKVASVSYTAPESCTVAPMLALTVTPGVCNSVNNAYALTGTISLTAAVASTLTISDGATSTTVSVSAGQTSATFSLTGLNSGTGEHIITVSGTGYAPASATYNAPESCTVAPALSVAVTPGTCNTATNQYDLTGTVSFTAAIASTLTISDGTSTTTVSVTAGQTSVSFSLTGLNSGTGDHTVFVTGNGYSPASTTYTAPESCTVCSLSLTTAALANGQVGTAYSQTLTTTGGTAPLTFAVAGGSLPAGIGLNTATGVISGTPTSATTSSFSITVTDGKSCSALVPLTIVIGNVPVCSLTATATPTDCNTATNQYTVTGTISATNTTGNQSLTVAVGSEASTVVSLTGNGPVSFTLTGLESDGLVKTLTVMSSATACGMVSTTYTAPVSCTVAPQLASLGDKVFQDNNANGLQDPNIDTPLPGVTVTLISNGTVVATTTTASSGTGIGCYSFTGLTPGVPYSVSFTTPVGFSATTPLVGDDRGVDSDPVNGITAPVTLTAGENNITIDAGFVPVPVPVGSIGDFVWKDNNNNGQFDTNEPPVPGVQVQLFTVSGGITSTSALQTTVTDGNGQYTFAGLPSGDYKVKFTVPASLTDACQLTNKPLSGTDKTRDSDADPLTGFSPIVTINASGTGIAKDNPTIDAGLQRRIYDPVGYIYCYRDGTILKGGTISVTGPGSISITQDGSKGYYQFFTDSTPGSYTLSYNNPNAFGIATSVRPPAGPFIVPTGLEGTPTDKDGILNGWVRLGSDVNADSTALLDSSAANNPYYLVFNVKPGDPYVSENNLPIECTPSPLGSIGDFVWKDLDKNGQQDSGEPGVNGVTVRLLEQTSPGNFTLVSTTATTGNGAYLFPNLPAGTYVVEFDKTTLPASLTFTTPNASGVPTNLDSDAIPTAGNPMVARSAPVTIVPTDPTRRNDLTIDAGIFDTACPPTKCVPLVIQQIRGPRR